MAEVNAKVLDMVRREMARNPAVTNDALRKKAAAIDSSVRKLTPLQFHGTYRLTASRALASGGNTKRQPTAARSGKRRDTSGTRGPRKRAPVSAATGDSSADRATVRATLLELAAEVAGAESKTDIIAVLGSLDRYVDRVLAASNA
jgi:hypothetical protein